MYIHIYVYHARSSLSYIRYIKESGTKQIEALIKIDVWMTEKNVIYCADSDQAKKWKFNLHHKAFERFKRKKCANKKISSQGVV